MSDMMRVDEQPTWGGMTPRQMQVEIEQLRAEIAKDTFLHNKTVEMLASAQAEIERLKTALELATEPMLQAEVARLEAEIERLKNSPSDK
jgi:uncharacterized small protein (DUF1192 family)